MVDRLDVFDPYEDKEGGSGLTDFLYPTPAPRNTLGIIKWWEARRLKYNLIVGGAGSISVLAGMLFSSLPPYSFSIPMVWQPIVVFGVLANFFYLLGPTAELAIEKLSRGKILPTGPGLFRMGLTFSVGLALLPTLLIILGWGLRILNWVF